MRCTCGSAVQGALAPPVHPPPDFTHTLSQLLGAGPVSRPSPAPPRGGHAGTPNRYEPISVHSCSKSPVAQPESPGRTRVPGPTRTADSAGSHESRAEGLAVPVTPGPTWLSANLNLNLNFSAPRMTRTRIPTVTGSFASGHGGGPAPSRSEPRGPQPESPLARAGCRTDSDSTSRIQYAGLASACGRARAGLGPRATRG